LWEGSYRAAPIDGEAYFLACCRTIELNPVRARMVRHPRDYAWSSYNAHARGAMDPLLSGHALFDGLGASPADRRKAYQEPLPKGFRCENDEIAVERAKKLFDNSDAELWQRDRLVIHLRHQGKKSERSFNVRNRTCVISLELSSIRSRHLSVTESAEGSRLIQGGAMCDECQELERKIQHYGRFTEQPLGPLTIERIKATIKDLEKPQTDAALQRSFAKRLRLLLESDFGRTEFGG
jgi:hypothetical protein